jgi:aldehyde:ferredoxin oxidoreductase
MYGYAGKILEVNLTNGSLKDIDSSKYLPEWVGGVGLGYRILWEYTDENTKEWDPENTLIFATGPTNGTCIPATGRTELVGIAPMGYPEPWACASGAGGDWSAKLKWAGYDAVIITGKSEEPVFLYIDENGAKLEDAANLWGTGTYTAQQWLETRYGKDIAAYCIGQAGENKVRFATIEANSENSFGQGGFGAVMGDKKIKAICVKPGSHRIELGNPTAVLNVTKKLSYELGPTTPNHPVSANNTPVYQDYGTYTSRRLSCPYSNCQANVHDCLYWTHNRVPAAIGTGSFTGTCGCAAGSGLTGQMDTAGMVRTHVVVETHNMMSNWGVNTWSGTFGGLIRNAYAEGLITHVCGLPLTEDGRLSPENTIKFFKMIINREGEGDIWAENGPRAADALGLQSVAWKDFKHGYTPHWDGRNQGPRFPMWIGAALMWAVWPRDAFNDNHGWPERVPWYVKEWGGKGGAFAGKDMVGRDAIPYADLCVAAAKLYGAPDALSGYPGLEDADETLGYKDKEYPVKWHNEHELFKNSCVMCDCVLPLLFDSTKPDLLGYYMAEIDAFNACTGLNWTLEDAHLAGERILNVMRAINIRQGRTRAHDESVIRFFTDIPSSSRLPAGMGEEEHYLNREKFIELMERYYALRGWDVAKAWPTRAKLEELDLKFIADGLGAIGKLP